MKDGIISLLDKVNRKEALKIIGEILDEEYDLRVASNLVKKDCDPALSKMMFEDSLYSEGNEEAGFISLRSVLKAAEEVINCDDYISSDIEFQYFVRPETPEESEEVGHSDNVEWWTEDESIDIDNLYIQFES